MGEHKFNITPELVAGDLLIADTLLHHNDKMNQILNNGELSNLRKETLCNYSGYHAAQAIEKSLKLMMYKRNPELYNEQSLYVSHSIQSILVALEMVEPSFITNHMELTKLSKSMNEMNTARYGDISVSENFAEKLFQCATNIYHEMLVDYGITKEQPVREEPKQLCNNDNYISQAMDLIEQSMRSWDEVNTPNGKANPADGYTVNNVKQGYLHIQLDVTMLSRSQKEGDKPKDGDRCTFFISKGRVYDEKQWADIQKTAHHYSKAPAKRNSPGAQQKSRKKSSHEIEKE